MTTAASLTRAKFFFALSASTVVLFHAAWAFLWPDVFYFPDSLDFFDTLEYWDSNHAVFVGYLRTPAYPLFFLVLHKTLGLGLLALVQHSSLAAMIVLSGLVMGRMLKSRQGWIIAGIFTLVAGFAPSQFMYASHAMTEGLATQALLAVILCFILWMSRSSALSVAVLGLVLAMAVLLRAVNVILVPLALAFVLVITTKNRGARKALLHAAILCAVFFITVFPWMRYNKIVHSRFALSNMGALALVHSYSHLIDMDSGIFSEIKNVLRPVHEKEMEAQKSLSPEALMFDGMKRACGENSYFDILMKKFGYTIPQLDKVMKALVFEGMKKRPDEVASLVLRRFWHLITRAPGLSERALVENLYFWVETPPSPNMRRDAPALFTRYGLVTPLSPGAAARKEKARHLWRIEEILSGFYVRAAPAFLWLGVLLLPALRRRGPFALGLFCAGLVFAPLGVTAAMTPPEFRFYQPFSVPVMFLLALEISAFWPLMARAAGYVSRLLKKPESSP